MRPLRFRVWDKKRKEWVHGPGNEPNLFGECILLGAFLCRNDWSHVSLDELNDMVAVQFTGLKDIKGKEIYEGDILKMGEALFPVTYASQSFYPSLMYLGEVVGNIFENPALLQEAIKYDEEN
jgi:uncharacterized phage protein (TIGR01671 family)